MATKHLNELAKGDTVKVIEGENFCTMVFSELDGEKIGKFKTINSIKPVGSYSEVTFQDGSIAYPFPDYYVVGSGSEQAQAPIQYQRRNPYDGLIPSMEFPEE